MLLASQAYRMYDLLIQSSMEQEPVRYWDTWVLLSLPAVWLAWCVVGIIVLDMVLTIHQGSHFLRGLSHGLRLADGTLGR